MAITPVLLSSTENQLVYEFTAAGADNGDLTLTTLLAAAKANSAMKTALTALDGQTNGTDAVKALITGATFTGVGGASITSDIQTCVVSSTSAAAPAVSASEDGTSNDPKLNVALAAAGTVWCFITHRHSVIV